MMNLAHRLRRDYKGLINIYGSPTFGTKIGPKQKIKLFSEDPRHLLSQVDKRLNDLGLEGKIAFLEEEYLTLDNKRYVIIQFYQIHATRHLCSKEPTE